MKRTVIICGLIAGAIVSATMLISIESLQDNSNFEGNMVMGFGSMILSFSLIFVGIKNYRDKYNNGVIRFGKAFMIGLYISLIASTCYVVTWLFDFYLFIPDFMDKYSDYLIKAAEKSGATPEQMQEQLAEIKTNKELYKNPLFVILMTYFEILPIGLLVSVIAALILKKKMKVEPVLINN